VKKKNKTQNTKRKGDTAVKMGDPKAPCGLTWSSLPIDLTVGKKGQHILYPKVTN